MIHHLTGLAVRMRRNSDSVLDLTGEAPQRLWAAPAPLTDVLASAAKEIEQGERVAVHVAPETATVVGAAVDDLAHLVAELLDNATCFSSPLTQVTVTGGASPDGGCRLDVHDMGIGLSDGALDKLNARLAVPPLTPPPSRRLGIYLTSHLAHRHSIRVVLRRRSTGGVTAHVALPEDLLVQP